MGQQPRHLRIFLSSPGDVADERNLALKVIDNVQYDPFVRGKVTFEPIAWDKPGSGTVLLATETPQAAINAGLPKPSDCDIVIVLFWARMGTPLPHPEYQKANGEPYYSGTEWEYENALSTALARGHPKVVVYRRTEKVLLDPHDPNFTEQVEQIRRVDTFFARFQDPSTKSILSGYNQYSTPDTFSQQFETHLKELILKIFASAPDVTSGVHDKNADLPPLWQGSPFPGLRAFTSTDAPIFFGRGRETDELLKRIARSRFVAVVGASGSGKSSLVAAGVLPRLVEGTVPDTAGFLLPEYNNSTHQWEGLRFTPGEVSENPFMSLALKLAPLVAGAARDIAAELQQYPAQIATYCTQALKQSTPGMEILIFVDQFEELFTLVDKGYRHAFVALLESTAQSINIRTVITMRSDFYRHCIDLPTLARLLELGQFPLSAPEDTLLEMISRPAERAGVRFEEGLPGRILRDTGQEPGSLPLLAYTLDELYHACKDEGVLSHKAYTALGGVQGAIGTRAEFVFNKNLDDATRGIFSSVFRKLVDVNEQGQIARRRAHFDQVAHDPSSQHFVAIFTEARLFVQSQISSQTESLVEVAHEALFHSWVRLQEWIETVQEDLRMLRKVTIAAMEWNDHARDETYLWPQERLEPIYAMMERLEPDLDSVTQLFIRPEYERLFRVFTRPEIEDHRRQAIADRLAAIGGKAIPNLLDSLSDGNRQVRYMATSALIKCGQSAVPPLLERINDSNPEVRLQVVGVLRVIGDQSSIPNLLSKLHDPDIRVRSLAVGTLQSVGGVKVVQGLHEALRDSDVDVRWRAAGALGVFGVSAIQGLVTALRDKNLQVRSNALNALSVMNESALPGLLTLLRDTDVNMRWGAGEALVAIGPSAVPRLLLVLKEADIDADVRWRVVEILMSIGDSKALPGLIDALQDPDLSVRRAATDALKITKNLVPPGLVEALLDEDADTRWTAGETLSSIAAIAIPYLLELLQDRKNTIARAIIIAALSRIGAPAIPGLLQILHHKDPEIRLRAADALAQIGQPAVTGLLECLRFADSEIRQLAHLTLQSIDKLDIASLLDWLSDSDAFVRASVAELLGNFDSPEIIMKLNELLGDSEQNVRLSAAKALGTIGLNAVPHLLQALYDNNNDIQVAAGIALVEAGGVAVPGLLEALKGSNSLASEIAAKMLGRIKTPMSIINLTAHHNKMMDNHNV